MFLTIKQKIFQITLTIWHFCGYCCLTHEHGSNISFMLPFNLPSSPFDFSDCNMNSNYCENIEFGQNYILIKNALSLETVNKILDLPNHCEKVIDRSRFRDFGTYNDNSIHYRDDYIGDHYNYHYESPIDDTGTKTTTTATNTDTNTNKLDTYTNKDDDDDDHEIFCQDIPNVEKFEFGHIATHINDCFDDEIYILLKNIIFASLNMFENQTIQCHNLRDDHFAYTKNQASLSQHVQELKLFDMNTSESTNNCHHHSKKYWNGLNSKNENDCGCNYSCCDVVNNDCKTILGNYYNGHWNDLFSNCSLETTLFESRDIEYIEYYGKYKGEIGWHVDVDSIITLVMGLSNSNNYKGGYLQVSDENINGTFDRINMNNVFIESIKLNIGDIVLFPSETTSHRVTPVLNGKRKVLTIEYWNKSRAVYVGQLKQRKIFEEKYVQAKVEHFKKKIQNQQHFFSKYQAKVDKLHNFITIVAILVLLTLFCLCQ